MKKFLFFSYLVISFSSFSQNTITWVMQSDVAGSSSGNNHPRLALDAQGNPLVLWGHVNRAMFSRWNGSMFTAPVMINPASRSIAEATWMGPDIASLGDTIYIVMKQIPEASDTSHILIRKSIDGGMTFGSIVQVDNINDSISRFPTVTIDNNGNPIVGFMKFDAAFGNSRWVAARSNDLGNTFQIDHKASGWSGGLICDCCPGTILHNGNSVHMVYRDNLNNDRVIWDGVSTNNGANFAGGFLVDQTAWNVNMCPGSGPDAVIIGDTLYTTFFNSVTGTARVYLSRSSVSNQTCSSTNLLTGNITGLSSQNYPRIASFGNALAVCWTQNVSGNDQLMMRFTNNILNGLPISLDTIDLGNVTNCDVILSNGKIFVVWEDDNSGTIKCRTGTFIPDNTSVNSIEENELSIFLNPSSDVLNVKSEMLKSGTISVFDIFGRTIFSSSVLTNNFQLSTYNYPAGFYFLQITLAGNTFTKKFVKE